MGDCFELFGSPWPQEGLAFKHIIDRRKALDQELKTVGKIFIPHCLTSFTKSQLEPKFLDSLRRVDHAHQVLVDSVKPFVKSDELINNVSMERLKHDLNILKKDKARQFTLIGKLEKVIADNILTHEKEKKIWRQTEQELDKEINQLRSDWDQEFRKYKPDRVISDNVTRKMQHLQQVLSDEKTYIENLKHQLEKCQQENTNLNYQNDLLKLENKRERQNQQSNVQIENELAFTKIRQALNKKSLELQVALEENQQLKQHTQSLTEANSSLTSNISYNHEINISMLNEENSKLKADLFNANQKLNNITLQLIDTSNILSNTENLASQLQDQVAQLHGQDEQNKGDLRKQHVAYQILHNENKQLKKEIIALKEQLETRPQQPPPEEPEEEDEKAKALKQIGVVHESADKLEKEVLNFSGTKEDKQYLHLKEMLLKLIIKLDNIETGGLTDVREERKIVIKYIQRLLKLLNENVQPEITMDED